MLFAGSTADPLLCLLARAFILLFLVLLVIVVLIFTLRATRLFDHYFDDLRTILLLLFLLVCFTIFRRISILCILCILLIFVHFCSFLLAFTRPFSLDHRLHGHGMPFPNSCSTVRYYRRRRTVRSSLSNIRIIARLGGSTRFLRGQRQQAQERLLPVRFLVRLEIIGPNERLIALVALVRFLARV
uniref:Uncharacterized protein n=1 Tax=Anopheles braziliensis TaxID=58242 RepID=A0A2M3ZLH7_9DIPT